MADDFFIEELLIDDSFANYCFQRNEQDILFWKEYIRTHPHQQDKIAEAVQLVLGLHAMLKQEHEADDKNQSPNLTAVKGAGNKQLIQKMIRYAAVVAAVFFIMIAGKKIIELKGSNRNNPKNITLSATPTHLLLYKTAKGEKQNILLPDSSRLTLNAGSELRVDKDFGKSNRTVYLTGEALFDVKHNISLPFIVHIDKYDVRVIGTLFNVKAYPGDKLSETALIRGKVEISLKNNPRKITLTPNQKAVIDNTGSNVELQTGSQGNVYPAEKVRLLPLSYSSKDSMVIETAWSQNRLEIVNESFTNMKEELERWFNVKIIFKDKEVGDYTFSATFEKETIGEVLVALQNAYHFRYEINDNDITISK